MSATNTQDLQPPFDPTAFASISGAQLLQYITGTYPAIGIGMVITESGTTAAPTIPDASVTTKWQNYVFQHIYTDTNSIAVFVWNPNQSSPLGPTYLNWQPIATASIASGSIQGYQIAANTITAGNIASVNWSSIVNAPTSLPPNGTAGGVLTGSYPNPSIVASGITSAMIAQNAITGGATGQLAVGATGVDITQNIKVPTGSTYGSPSGSSAGAPIANDRVVIGVGATAYATTRKALDALAEPSLALSVIQVNSAGNGFQYSTIASNRILQDVIITSGTKTNTSSNLANTTTLPNANTTGMTTMATFGTTFTPISASSTLFIEATINVGWNTAGAVVFIGLYNTNSGATAPVCYGNISGPGTANCVPVSFRSKLASSGTSALTFYLMMGVSGSAVAYLNSVDGSTTLFGGILSQIRITEYL